MKTERSCRSWRILAIIALLAGCACFAVGCQSVGHLRQAQDAFSEAARIDLQMTFAESFSDDEVTPIPKGTTARSLYGAALAHLDMISSEEEASLKKNKLYGTVLTLKALCYWKLKEYNKALDVKKEADKQEKGLISRDKQILELLPVLIAMDEALPIVKGMSGKQKEDKAKGFERIRELLLVNKPPEQCASLCTIDKVLNDEAMDKPMKIYAQQLKLMALKRYFDAYGILHVGSEACPPENDVYWKKARKTLGELQETAGGSSDPVAIGLVNSWTTRIGCGITVDTGSNP